MAYESVLILSLMRKKGNLYETFKTEVQSRARADYDYTLDDSEAVSYVYNLFIIFLRHHSLLKSFISQQLMVWSFKVSASSLSIFFVQIQFDLGVWFVKKRCKIVLSLGTSYQKQKIYNSDLLIFTWYHYCTLKHLVTCS